MLLPPYFLIVATEVKSDTDADRLAGASQGETGPCWFEEVVDADDRRQLTTWLERQSARPVASHTPGSRAGRSVPTAAGGRQRARTRSTVRALIYIAHRIQVVGAESVCVWFKARWRELRRRWGSGLGARRRSELR
jgi:hypothetical protein